jgi:acyl-CoA thioester hydrolase
MLTVGAGSVQVHECDAMGHMNVRFYVARATDALTSLALTLGLGPRFARSQHVYVAMAEAHIRFLGEMRPGTPFVFQGGILQMGEKPRFYLEMRDVATNRVAATFTIVAGLVDSQTASWRIVPPLEGTVGTIRLPDYAAPRAVALDPPRSIPTWAEAEALGLVLGYEGMVTPAECNEYALMRSEGVIARVWDAVPNLSKRLEGAEDAMPPGGRAALEYRIIHHTTPRSGDVLAIRAGLRAVGAKTINPVNWLLDRETGETVATAESVIVGFDRQTRKTVEISDAARRALERHIVPGLSV